MSLLDLPPELVHKILLPVIFSRRISRSLRLKLVCKRFSQDVQFALFESRLLENYPTWQLSLGCNVDNDHSANIFWHSYLVYRVRYQSESCPPRFRHIRRIAAALYMETGNTLDATIETLCWPALVQGIDSLCDSGLIFLNLELDILCCAVYLNFIPIAKQLLNGKYWPSISSDLSGTPMLIAAWTGNAHLLECFRERMCELKGYDPYGLLNRDTIVTAATKGDLDIVRLTIYPPLRAMPDSTEFMGQSFGNIFRHSNAGCVLSEAQSSTRSFEVYKYLEAFFIKSEYENFQLVQIFDFPRHSYRGPNHNNGLYPEIALTLEEHVSLGNLEIVKYILDIGIDICGSLGRDLVAVACLKCHEDIVDLLLERGADPNFEGLEEERLNWLGDKLISIRSEARELPIVRKLLNHGANLCQVQMGDRALEWAVSREDTAMVKMLLASQVDLASWGGNISRSAASRGLDSMAEILQGEFFKLSVLQRARWVMIFNGTIDPARPKEFERVHFKENICVEGQGVKTSFSC